MSLRDKAREVKEAGVQERSNFTPTGVPKRIYQWWLKESTSKRARAIKAGTRMENFCHFWRVVLFWAPARKVAHGALVASPFVGGLLAVAAVVAFVWGLIVSASMLQFVLTALAAIAGCAFAVGGIVGGSSLAMNPVQRKRNDMPNFGWSLLLSLLGLPTAIVSYLITAGTYFYKAHCRDYDRYFLIALLSSITLAGVLCIGLSTGWINLLWLGVAIVAIAAVIAGLIFVGSFIADYISGRRVKAKERTLQARLDFYDKHGKYPEDVEVEPGRLAKFFSGLGDFIVLLAQVVRVNKWKICPLVEVERPAEPELVDSW